MGTFRPYRQKAIEKAAKNDIWLSFDDLYLKSRYSDIDPYDPALDVSGKFSRNFTLPGAPVVSAAMDTVTEEDMAIMMALLGGAGVVHRNMSPKRQAKIVQKVKATDPYDYVEKLAEPKEHGYLIECPDTVSPDCTIDELYQKAVERGYHTFIVNTDDEPVGIVTRRDMRFGKEMGFEKVSEIMSEDLKYEVWGTPKKELLRSMLSQKIEKLLIKDGDGFRGLVTLNDLLKSIYNSQHHAGYEALDLDRMSVDGEGHLKVAAAVGVIPKDAERIDALYSAGADCLVFDSSHGCCDAIRQTLEYAVENYGGSVELVAGNVVTKEEALKLAKWGATGIKVGIGPGRTCTTRTQTGVGAPQVSAVYFIKKALRGRWWKGYRNIAVVADGGIKFPGYLPKVFAAGADSVMIGTLLAGTKEAPGKFYIGKNGHVIKNVRGMGSKEAREDSWDHDPRGPRVGYGKAAEGIQIEIPYSGTVDDVIGTLVGGLKTSMAHEGTKYLKDLARKGKLLRVTEAGRSEGATVSLGQVYTKKII